MIGMCGMVGIGKIIMVKNRNMIFFRNKERTCVDDSNLIVIECEGRHLSLQPLVVH